MKHVALTALLLTVPHLGLAQNLSFDLFKDAEVVFLGEVHDNPLHHDTQAQAVLALAPKAIVFEMLSPAQAAAVTDTLLDDEAALEATLGWNASGWPDFSMYYPVFAVSEGAKVYGAQVPREAVRKLVSDGDYNSALGDDAAVFGLDRPLPKAQQEEREAMQLAAHCDALPAEMLPVMVMAQRVRDAKLAQVATQALAETGGPVAVITGNGHARADWGAPALLGEAVFHMSLGQFEAEPADAPAFDIWQVTAPAEREDPCAAFQ